MNRKLANRILAAAALAAGGLFLAGCQTASVEMPEARLDLPSGHGDQADGEIIRGLRVRVEPDVTELQQGQPLEFDCLLANVGPSAIKLPSSPRVLITCIYPDGTRFFGLPDNHEIIEALGSHVLKPGETIRRSLVFDTQKLHQSGLLELRMLFTFAQMNPAADRDAWLGRVLSNGYGIRVVEPLPIDAAPALSALAR